MKRVFLGQRVRITDSNRCGTVIAVNPPSQINDTPEVVIYSDEPLYVGGKSKATHTCLVDLTTLEECQEGFNAQTPLQDFFINATPLRNLILGKIESNLQMARLLIPNPRLLLGAPYGDGCITITYDPKFNSYTLSPLLAEHQHSYSFKGDADRATLELISYYWYGFAESYKKPSKKKRSKKSTPAPQDCLPLPTLPYIDGEDETVVTTVFDYLPLPSIPSESDILPVPGDAEDCLPLPMMPANNDEFLIWTPPPSFTALPLEPLPKKKSRKRLKGS
jgi:hypothetical protein